MPSYRSIAANVAQHKENHPELYCPARRCLWRTGDGSRCPRHKQAALPGANVLPCGCVRRFVGGRMQTVRCLQHATARKENDQ